MPAAEAITSSGDKPAPASPPMVSMSAACHHCREGNHAAHREVDTRGDDHHGHADSEDGNDSDLAGDIPEIVDAVRKDRPHDSSQEKKGRCWNPGVPRGHASKTGDYFMDDAAAIRSMSPDLAVALRIAGGPPIPLPTTFSRLDRRPSSSAQAKSLPLMVVTCGDEDCDQVFWNVLRTLFGDLNNISCQNPAELRLPRGTYPRLSGY